jgi:hypothetical protein
MNTWETKEVKRMETYEESSKKRRKKEITKEMEVKKWANGRIF